MRFEKIDSNNTNKWGVKHSDQEETFSLLNKEFIF